MVAEKNTAPPVLRLMKNKNAPRRIIKGGCDVDAIWFYLEHRNVIKEGSRIGTHGVFYYSGHSEVLVSSANSSRRPNTTLDEVEAYKTELWSCPSSLKTVVFSILSEGGCGLYFDVQGRGLVYGGCDDDATKSERRDYCDVKDDDYCFFFKNFKFVGRTPLGRALENYKFVIDLLPHNTKVVVILGPTVHGELMEMSPVFRDSAPYFAALNAAMVNAFKEDTRVNFIDPNPFILRANGHLFKRYFFYNYQTIAHYKRIVYFMLAKELHKIDKSFKPTLKNEIRRDFRKLFEVIVSFPKRVKCKHSSAS